MITERDKLWPILFWGSSFGQRRPMNAIAELFVAFTTGRVVDPQPKDCIRTDIPRTDREALGHALAGGLTIESYFGDARCRICNINLGNKDLGGYGFLWPEKAEHYVLEHDVWTPGCRRLLDAIRTT